MTLSNRPKSNSEPVIVLGAGGHATALIGSLQRLDKDILGVTERAEKNVTGLLGVEVLGGDDIIFSYQIDEVMLVNGIGMVSGSLNRQLCAIKMRQAGYRFCTVVDPTAVISSEIEISEGVQVMAGAVLQPRVYLGVDTIINTGAIIDHDCVIKTGCHICPGVTLAGAVTVEHGTFIGSGTTVIPGIVIGEESVIGAGSIITEDIPPRSRIIQRKLT